MNADFTVKFSWSEDTGYTAVIEEAPFFLSDEDWNLVEDLAVHFSESYILEDEKSKING